MFQLRLSKRHLLNYGKIGNRVKLDPRTLSCFFIGYAETPKGYRFYCPSHSTKIVESRNARFLENDMINGRDRFRDLIHVHDHIETQPSTSYDRLVIVHNSPHVTPRFPVRPEWRIRTGFQGTRPNWDSLPDFFLL